MSLQSQLFRGDAKLEAAAVSDPAHILPGASGPHVAKIQQALIQSDGAAIAADGKYGPATAAAVSAFKQKRQILNTQGKIDNIVGKKTIDRLDKEMLAAAQSKNNRTPRCIFPPQQSTRRSLAVGGGPVRDGPVELTGFKLLEEMRASLPLARSWIATTLAKISQVEGKIKRFKVYTAEDIAFFSSIETHFKVNIPNVSESLARDRLLKIRQMYLKIQNVLTVINRRVIGNPSVPAKATAPLGGIDIPTDFITIGRDFHESNANMRAAVLIHEGGHFADRSCSHAASEQPAPNGEAMEDEFFGAVVNPGKLNYAQLDFNLHMQNAYSFAQCAMHNGLGFDKRPP